MQIENSFHSQVDSSRCFLRALAKAPTSFMGLAVAHLLHFRNSRNLLVSTSMYSLESFTPQLKDPAVVPSAKQVYDLCPFCVYTCGNLGSMILSAKWNRTQCLRTDPSDASSLEESFRRFVNSWVWSVDVFGVFVCCRRHHA